MKITEEITLENSDFINTGTCKYVDGFGNKVIMKRDVDGQGFSAKLFFYDKRIKAERINVRLPVKEEGGNTLHFDYPGDVSLEDEGIKSGVNMVKELIDRWVDIHFFIARLGMKPEWFMKDNPGMTEEEINELRCQSVLQFPEIGSAGLFQDT